MRISILPMALAVLAVPALISTPLEQTGAYQGARSGTLQSSGSQIPQNAEYVFRDVPLVKLRLDYDQQIWDAKLVPADGKTQKLIVKNKSKGPQKKCVVHWIFEDQ